MTVHVIIPMLGWSDAVARAAGSAEEATVWLVQDGPAPTPWDRYTVVERPSRGGYAAACNSGARAVIDAGGTDEDVLLFLNDDAVLPEGAVAAVEDALRLGDTGAVGFSVRGPGGFAPQWPAREVGDVRIHLGPTLDGCAFAVTLGTFRRFGGFDEAYGMYGEETDLFARMQRAGLALVQLPLEVWHAEGASSAGLPLRRLWWAMRNPVRCAILNESPLTVARRVGATLVRAFTLSPHRPLDLPAHARRQRTGPVVLRIGVAFAALAANLVTAPVLLARRGNLSRGSLYRRG